MKNHAKVSQVLLLVRAQVLRMQDWGRRVHHEIDRANAIMKFISADVNNGSLESETQVERRR
jgi:hypothetical protein